MKSYLAIAEIDLKLAIRNRSVIFFNYIFPLVFFFVFSQLLGGQRGGQIVQVVTMVLILGILGNGLFGAGMRAVQEREMNILRRFKVAPIGPVHMLAAAMFTGWITFMPLIALVLGLAHWMYAMPIPASLFSLMWIVTLGVISLRSIGLIVGAVVNSMQEASIVLQLLYLPMLFLSGATFPIAMLPRWVQLVSQFMPASYLATGIQGILLRNESLAQNWLSAVALIMTTIVATFVASQLFRWEKEEKIRSSAKLWILGAFAPFLLLGAYQMYSRENVERNQALYRALRRNAVVLVRNTRIFTGTGKVIESGAVLIKGGKIQQIYEGFSPDPAELKAEPVEGAGKTLMPGLIDAKINLIAPGGFPEATAGMNQTVATMERHLGAYLFSGVIGVITAGDSLNISLRIRTLIDKGEKLGAGVFVYGPLFTAEGGAGTEMVQPLPAFARAMAERQSLRLPKTPEDARQQVDELKQSLVDGVAAVLDNGFGGPPAHRLEPAVLKAIGLQAHKRDLRFVVQTGDARDVQDALAANADAIQLGSFREVLPDAVFEEMARRGIAYIPSVVAVEALIQLGTGDTQLLNDSLTQQVGPERLIRNTIQVANSPEAAVFRRRMQSAPFKLEYSMENLRRAHRAGVTLLGGSSAGSPLLIHGPSLHRELHLWVQAGIPPQVALQAATANAAHFLRADNSFGAIQTDRDADLVLVTGNPLQDISDTERISNVFFNGENLYRPGLLEQR